MSTREYIVDFQKKILDPKVLTASFETAVLDLNTQMAQRIFIEGKNQQGSLTGHGAYNDNKPIYVNPDLSPGRKFTPAGNPNATRKKSTPHKTKWFPSYKAYRGAIGRRTDVVNLDLSNDLRFDFTAKKKGGKGENPKKVNDFEFQLVLSRQENSDKRKGLEERYNNEIFTPSKDDLNHFLETLNFQIQKRISA